MNSQRHDSDTHKGAVENERRGQESNTSMGGQLSHREQDPRIKGNDTDYPEPGENKEHSGEQNGQTIKPVGKDLRSHSEQKTNQNSVKEDPLAS